MKLKEKQKQEEILQIVASMSELIDMAKVGIEIIKESQQEVYKLIAAILDVRKDKKKVVGIAEGRSALQALWPFLMRLVHIDITAYASGQVGFTTPAISEGDLILVVSGSGTTDTNVARCETLKKEKIPNVKVILITYDATSILAKEYADIVICLPEKNAVIEKRKQQTQSYLTTQLIKQSEAFPLGTFFEIITATFLNAVIARLMKIIGVTEEMMRNAHIKDKT